MQANRVLHRLQQLYSEVQHAHQLDYVDRLAAFKEYCEETVVISSILQHLPEASYNLELGWRETVDQWSGGSQEYGYAMRWAAIRQIASSGFEGFERAWIQLGERHMGESSPGKLTERFVTPIYNYLVDQLETTSAMLYTLLRYKRWSEWFAARQLRQLYEDEHEGGEDALDLSVRRFLFESGVDYPFSKPASPRGEADIAAGLETEDPLVLEIKIWETKRSYKKNRIRDGLRQVMDYAAKYGKDKGYVVVFNLDREPLVFIGDHQRGTWPARLEYGGRTYYFIAIDIAEQVLPVSQRDRGSRVRVNQIEMVDLVRDIDTIQ